MKVPVLFPFGRTKQQTPEEYALEQALYFNVNGLITNTANDYGTTGATDLVSSYKSVSVPNFGFNLENTGAARPTLTAAPFLNPGKGLIFNKTQFLIANNSVFTPEWNQEFWTAAKFKYTGRNTEGFRQVYHFVGELLANLGSLKWAILARDLSDKVNFVMNAYHVGTGSWKRKEIKTDTGLVLGNEYVIITHHKGTDSISDDVIYINKIPTSFSTLSDTSFSGCTLYPGLNQNVITIGKDERADTGMIGTLGGSLFGFGSPKVNLIDSILNSNL